MNIEARMKRLESLVKSIKRKIDTSLLEREEIDKVYGQMIVLDLQNDLKDKVWLRRKIKSLEKDSYLGYG